jgi:SAM-dependent methyltransferase
MPRDEKTTWNGKYAAGSHASLEPEPLLVMAVQQFLSGPPGYALDVAGGTGRHAIWLAQRGWRVRLVDISETAAARALENAARMIPVPAADASCEPRVRAEVVDLNSAGSLGDEQYDLVMVFFYLQRQLFPALIRALKPGGLLIYQTYTIQAQLLGTGPANPEYLLQPGELLRASESMQILHYKESGLVKAGAAELVARKPRG